MRFIGNRTIPEKALYDPVEYLLMDMAIPPPMPMSHDDLVNFSKRCPNPLESGFTDNGNGLLVPKQSDDDLTVKYMQMAYPTYPTYPRSKPEKEPTSEKELQPQPFETNLMEPLVGWRRWDASMFFEQNVRRTGVVLRSLNGIVWKPGVEFIAECRRKYFGSISIFVNDNLRPHLAKDTPSETCTCGVYAVNEMQFLPDFNYVSHYSVIGEIYGWGRYVRGEDGWRAQYAYPRSFHLRNYQTDLIEPLRVFHVPIFIDEPLRVYDPTEEGYSNGYRQNNADGNFGADPGSSTTES